MPSVPPLCSTVVLPQSNTPHGTSLVASGVSTPAPYGRTPGGSRLLGPRDQDQPGWDLFLLSFRLDWPATLVVGPEQLLQYQVRTGLLGWLGLRVGYKARSAVPNEEKLPVP